MKIDLSGDYFEDSGIDSLVSELCENLSKYFRRKNYGNNKIKLFMIIICQPKSLIVRKRFDKKEEILYWDVILDYKTVKKTKMNLKKHILALNVINSFDILDKYPNLHLDKVKLKKDANTYFESINWIEST